MWIEWWRDGVRHDTASYRADPNPNGYGILLGPQTVDAGRWEVRVLNSRRQLYFRHAFTVR